MKVYILDEGTRFVYDESGDRRYVDVMPCPECMKYQWKENEKATVQKAVDLIFLLADFNRAVFHEETGCVSSSDLDY